MVASKQVSKVLSELCRRATALHEIECEKEHVEALKLMEELIKDYESNLIAIEALGNFIARYEAKVVSNAEFNNRCNVIDPAVATLKVLMDQYGLNTTDFKNEIGDKSMVSQILNGGKRLTRDHIERLAKRFGISAALFFK